MHRLKDWVSNITYRVRQNARKMGKVSLVNRQHTLRLDGLEQAIEHALVEVARLVVHSGHNGV